MKRGPPPFPIFAARRSQSYLSSYPHRTGGRTRFWSLNVQEKLSASTARHSGPETMAITAEYRSFSAGKHRRYHYYVSLDCHSARPPAARLKNDRARIIGYFVQRQKCSLAFATLSMSPTTAVVTRHGVHPSRHRSRTFHAVVRPRDIFLRFFPRSST